MTTQNLRITSGIDYSPLTGLIGTWQGVPNGGVNLIAVPNQKGDFTLLIAPYSEQLIISAVPATTPNRGLQVIQQLPTLSYNTTIHDSTDNSLMHVENGFWEVIDATANNGFGLFRLATIPHGNSLVAMGNAVTTDGPPDIDLNLNSEPVGSLPQRNGYTDPYIGPPIIPGFFPTSPNRYLSDYLATQNEAGWEVTQTTTIKISTQNQGGVNNIAQVESNTKVPLFDATFWIETLTNNKGVTMQQLQYSQRIMMEFPINGNMPGQTIIWPHINVNTLVLSNNSAV